MTNTDHLSAGSLVLAVDEARLYVGDARAPLTRFETAILAALMRRPGVIVSYEALLSALYPTPDDGPERSLNVLRSVISRIRAKASKLGASRSIVNVYGLGYRVEDTPEQAPTVREAVPDQVLATLRSELEAHRQGLGRIVAALGAAPAEMAR